MGRTLPTSSDQLKIEFKAFEQFRRALRREDQLIFDELFAMASNHRAEAALADRALPMEAFLLTMVIEVLKKVKHQDVVIEDLTAKLKK